MEGTKLQTEGDRGKNRKETLKGQSGALKIKTKIQQYMIQRT